MKFLFNKLNDASMIEIGENRSFFNSNVVSVLMGIKEDLTGFNPLLNEIIFQYLDPIKKAE
ncbi:hypothetical protein [Chryseobacterium aureum]|uniref:hypothetical protein n=1 Tax=Chryseobacterium aureum TaxID=2497456 RepID=UPI000F85E9CA|nr:hypothetical protein [Chryseobacterium aureum]